MMHHKNKQIIYSCQILHFNFQDKKPIDNTLCLNILSLWINFKWNSLWMTRDLKLKYQYTINILIEPWIFIGINFFKEHSKITELFQYANFSPDRTSYLHLHYKNQGIWGPFIMYVILEFFRLTRATEQKQHLHRWGQSSCDVPKSFCPSHVKELYFVFSWFQANFSTTSNTCSSLQAQEN